jgi:hypothetical protein
LTSDTSRSMTLSVGSTARFHCRTNKANPIGLQWARLMAGSRFIRIFDPTLMTMGSELAQRCSVTFNSTDGVSELTIRSVDPSDSGNYSCKEPEPPENFLTFELVVIGKCYK